jgi:ATP-dependent RNA helicase DDX31/DBP7
VSWVRFYASYPAKAKAYFHYKALHLGHYAKSFALRDPPSRIGGIGKKNWERSQSEQQQQYHQGGGDRRGFRLVMIILQV